MLLCSLHIYLAEYAPARILKQFFYCMTREDFIFNACTCDRYQYGEDLVSLGRAKLVPYVSVQDGRVAQPKLRCIVVGREALIPQKRKQVVGGALKWFETCDPRGIRRRSRILFFEDAGTVQQRPTYGF